MNDSMNRMNAQLTRGAGRMQKEIVIERLRANGCRITKQRLMLLDIILEEECASCNRE